MSLTVRIYETEQQARSAVAQLMAKDFPEDSIYLLTPAPGQEPQTVKAAIEAGKLPSSHANIGTQSLRKGRSIVALELRYGKGQVAIDIMDSCGAVDTDVLPAYLPRDPSPFSDSFGIPVLLRDSRSTTKLLTRSSKSFTSSFGLPLLSKNQRGKASLSTKRKNSSFGLPLLSKNQRGKSSSFGFSTLSRSKR